MGAYTSASGRVATIAGSPTSFELAQWTPMPPPGMPGMDGMSMQAIPFASASSA